MCLDAIPTRCTGVAFLAVHGCGSMGYCMKLRLTGNGEYHGFPLDDPKQYPRPEERLENVPRVTIPFHRL